HIESFAGEALAKGPRGPLLVRAPYAFGRVSLLALDMTEPALARWSGLPVVIRRVAGWDRSTGHADAKLRGGRLASSGIGDLATQLRATQDDFPSVRRFSLWGVMGLLLLYLL